jgi:hypothetical protein
MLFRRTLEYYYPDGTEGALDVVMIKLLRIFPDIPISIQQLGAGQMLTIIISQKHETFNKKRRGG